MSSIENDQKRASPELLRRLEDALGLHRDELLVLVHHMDAPPGVRERFEADRRRDAAARRLAELLRSSAREPGGLDRLYQTGVLGGLISQVSPEEGGAGGGGGGGGGANARARGGNAGTQMCASDEGAGGEAERNTESNAGGAIVPRAALGGVAGRLGRAVDVLIGAALPVEVPVINSVAAGYPSEFTDLGYPARVADAYIRQPDIRDPDAFAARVVGDSMEPQYHEGDIVVFSPAKTVASGMDCFVRMEPDHESTFKRVYFENESGTEAAGHQGIKQDAAATTRIRLQPLNPKYASRVLEREQVAGLYAAVSVTRMV